MPTSEKKLQQFTDADGHAWQIKLSIGLLDAVKAATNVDLLPTNNDVSALVGLTADHRKLSAILWALVERQAQSESIDRSAFMDAMDGQTLAAGWKCVCDSVIDWLDGISPGIREPLEKMIESQTELMAAGCQQIVAMLESPQFDAAVQDSLKEFGAQMRADVLRELQSIGEK